MTKLSLTQGVEQTLDGSAFEGGLKSVVFIGSKYPSTFLAKWQELIRKKLKITFQSYDPEQSQPADFLNHSWIKPKQELCFWLGEVTGINELPQNSQGNLFFFCTEQKFELLGSSLQGRKALQIKIPKIISPQILEQVFGLMGYKLTGRRLDAWKNAIKLSGSVIDLDFALKLAEYYQLTSAAHLKKLPDYLSSLTPVEQRFFRLPDLLFSGQWKEFFKVWDKVRDEFPSQFWVAFWTNAFYKACAAKSLPPGAAVSLTKGLARAAETTFFKKLSIERLKGCMLRIYKSDHDLKQGVGTGELEAILFELA